MRKQGLLPNCDENDHDDDDKNKSSEVEPLLQHQLTETTTSSTAAPLDESPPNALNEEQILKVVDKLEDDLDGQAYEELVPLEIKLAIERTLFGWTHLTSSILGHTAFTFGAFLIVYIALIPITKSPSVKWVRWFTALVAGWSSYRMVRRRRRIWFRAAYGTKEYLNFESLRRKDVEEADRIGWLGRMRRHQKQRIVERQLQRAENNFYRHHERRLLRVQSEPVGIIANSGIQVKSKISFKMDPVTVMESIQEDQILFSDGPIQRMPYCHGAFFGAAPFMLANPHWVGVLRHLMPDVYVEISRRVNAPPRRLILWAENNPVVAAYGTAYELEFNGTIPNMEWDVFLNPVLVERVHLVLNERERYLQTVMVDPVVVQPLGKIPGIEKLSPSQKGVLRYYEQELRQRVQLLVDKMLIAHGNLTQLILEQTGCAKVYNYSRVKRTRRTLGGGIYARLWLAVFAESLRLGVMEDGQSISSPSDAEFSPARLSLSRMTESSCPTTSITESVAIVKELSKRDNPVGLLLDLKSRHVSKMVWACVVDSLRSSGVRVEGVGSFTADDIRGISKHTSKPTKEILFFHSAGDLQRACHRKNIRYGDTVFFNGGSLLWTSQDAIAACFSVFDLVKTKESYRIQPYARRREDNVSGSTILDYKLRYNLSIGLYVQEFSIDEAAANLLVQHVNRHPDIFDLGMSWGGINGITIRGIQPGRFTSTDGSWNQRHIGAKWNSMLQPPI